MYCGTACSEYSQIRSSEPERNFAAAFFHMVTIALLCTSLAQMGWFRVQATGCPHHLAVYQFFDIGYFETRQQAVVVDTLASSIAISARMNLKGHDRTFNNSHFDIPGALEPLNKMTIAVTEYHSVTGTLTCVTPKIVGFMRLIVAFALIAIISSLSAFLLDISGPPKRFCFKSFRWIRRNSIFSIFTVVCCVIMVSASYYITLLISQEALTHRRYPGTIQVAFEYGFYTMTAAGVMAVIATACNLLQFPSFRFQSRESRSRLVEEWHPSIDSDTLISPPLPLNPSHDPPPPYVP